MWWKLILVTLASFTSAITEGDGTSKVFLTDRVVDKVRYHISSTLVTNTTILIQTSIDGSKWGNAVSNASPGTAELTGTIDGPIAYLRVKTVGATTNVGAALTVKALANVSP